MTIFPARWLPCARPRSRRKRSSYAPTGSRATSRGRRSRADSRHTNKLSPPKGMACPGRWPVGHSFKMAAKPRRRRFLVNPRSRITDFVGPRRQSSCQHTLTQQWVSCSENGGMLDERNVHRLWDRLRRRAQDPKYGVRPLGLHSARHKFASLALDSGRSIS